MILVGAGGMLGSAFSHYDVISLDRASLDISRSLDVLPTDADVLINCAAYTRVDDCETHIEEAIQINGTAVGNLAQWCNAHRVTLVHFSTDYVFDGQKKEPYLETDPTNPLSIYGKSKLAGEQAIIEHCQRYYIFRIQWLYGANGKHFVDTIIRLAKEKESLNIVNDQWGSPSWTHDIARCIMSFLKKSPDYGIYHLANTGYTSWLEFARFFLGPNYPLHPITTDQMPRPAKRPLNSRLCIDKYLSVGERPLPWQDAVRAYLAEKREY